MFPLKTSANPNHSRITQKTELLLYIILEIFCWYLQWDVPTLLHLFDSGLVELKLRSPMDIVPVFVALLKFRQGKQY